MNFLIFYRVFKIIFLMKLIVISQVELSLQCKSNIRDAYYLLISEPVRGIYEYSTK